LFADDEDKQASGSRKRLYRTIMAILGFLWIVDGILQLQPGSFTKAFVSSVLAPNMQGQPGFIPQLLNSGMALFTAYPFLANLGAAAVQIAVGVVLILPGIRRFKLLALWTSIAWAVVVWVIGEGMGNVFTGAASFYTGAPGSVMLYLIPAVFLLFPKKLSLARLPLVAGAIFMFGAILQLSTNFWSASGVQSIFQLASSDPVGFIAGPVQMLATAGLSAPGLTNLVLVIPLAIFGALLLLRPSLGIAWKAAVFLGLIWWFGQDFGGIQTFPTSTATDPQTAPLMILFLAPLFVGFPSRIFGGARAMISALPGGLGTTLTRVTSGSRNDLGEASFGVKQVGRTAGGALKTLAQETKSTTFNQRLEDF
jgi:hypothetical protein